MNFCGYFCGWSFVTVVFVESSGSPLEADSGCAKSTHPTAIGFVTRRHQTEPSTLLLQSHSVPTSAQLRASVSGKVLAFFFPLCHRHFLTHTDVELTWKVMASKTVDDKNSATAVGAAAALPLRRSKGSSHADADGIPHRDCAPCYAAAVHHQRAVAPARLSTLAGRPSDDFAPHPSTCLSPPTDPTSDRSRSVDAAAAGAPAIGAVVEVGATAEIRLVAPAGALGAKAALPPPRPL